MIQCVLLAYPSSMAATVQELLSMKALGLVLRFEGAQHALEAPIHWVHQSELVDSTLFTEPGEVLITAGTQLPSTGELPAGELTKTYDQYVRRLRDTSVVALGIGVGVHHETAPQALLDAARLYGLPVFEIPWEVPFSAVIKAVSKSRSDAEHAYLRRTNSAQRRLITAAGRENVTQSVVSATAQIISGWAALADSSGHVVVHTHTDQIPRAREALRQHQASGKAVSFTDFDSAHICTHTIASGGSARGILVAGTPGELDPLAISTCLLASNLLGVYLSLSGRLESSLSQIRTLVVDAALHGNPGLAQRAEGSLWLKVPRDPVQLICAEGPTTELNRIRLEDLPAAWGMVDGWLWIVTQPAHQAQISARIARRARLSQGTAPPGNWHDLPQARARALTALLHQDADQQMNLLDLLSPQQSAAFARARLGCLADPDAATLLETLEAYLQADGTIESAAETLEVHRHTVRRRMQHIAQLLGVDPTTPRERHELWFACEVLRRERSPLPPRATASSPNRRPQAQTKAR